jgi:hypothetical protein
VLGSMEVAAKRMKEVEAGAHSSLAEEEEEVAT